MDLFSDDVIAMALKQFSDSKELLKFAWDNDIMENHLVVRRLQEMEGQKVSILIYLLRTHEFFKTFIDTKLTICV